MRQRTLADDGFERFREPTRRELFLDEMEQIIPWRGLWEVINPFYSKPNDAGRPPWDLSGCCPFRAVLVRPLRSGLVRSIG